MSIERLYGVKPCPFCGSDNIWAEQYELPSGRKLWRVLCAQCCGTMDTGIDQMRSQAIYAWNRRAERTCRIYETDHEYEDSVRCSECKKTFHRPWQPFRFCPNCGARVVGHGA